MPDPKKIPTLDDIYASRQPNELEKSLAAQGQPGSIPNGWLPWVMASLPNSDPRKIAVKRAQINGITLTEEEVRAIFKQQ